MEMENSISTSVVIDVKSTFGIRVEAADMDFVVAIEAMKTSPDYIVELGLKNCLNDGVTGAKYAAIGEVADGLTGDKKERRAKAEVVFQALPKHEQTIAIRRHAKKLAEKRYIDLMAGTLRVSKAKTLADFVREALAKAVPGWDKLAPEVQTGRVDYVCAGVDLKPAAQKLLDACVLLFNGPEVAEVDMF